MAKSLAEELGARLSKIESRLNALSGNRLDHASLDGSTLYLKDNDGNLQGRLGRQPDGSNGVHVVRVQPPPQLTAPILTVGDMAGTCQVEWDGGTFDGRRMPLIHGHTEIWAELVGEDWSPTVAPGGSAKRVGTIRDRTGGEVTVSLPQAGMWAVWLRAMGADRETAGPWSPVSQVEIVPLVDTEQMEQDLQDAHDRLDQAEQDFQAGNEARIEDIRQLREERIPALQEALNTGLQSAHYEAEQLAEAARDNAVNQAAANAQSEYDRLQEIAERALSRAGDNVLEDPSFEANYWPGEWDGQGGRTVRTTSNPTRTGSRALVVEGGNLVALPLAEVNVEYDQTWRLQIWFRTWASSLPSDIGDGRLRLVDPDTDNVVAESDVFTVGSTFRRATVAYTIPEDGTLRAELVADHPDGIIIFDDVSLQEVGAAAEALRLAEVARQEAEAAHIAAGDAVDTAASAYDAASSKSTVHWSLSAPSGVGNSGDVWWQYETNNSRRTVIGEWHWESGVWREADIAEERLPLVDIGTGTYGDLHGDRLTANTVQAGALAVIPDTEDYAPNPGEHPELWDLVGATFAGSSNNPTGVVFRFGQRSGDTQIRGPWRPVTPGKKIRFRGRYTWFGGSTTGADTQVRMEWSATPEGGRDSYSTFVSIPDDSFGYWAEGVVTVPEDAAYGRLYIYQPSTSSSNYAGFGGNIECEPMVGTVLIEDGAVNSEKVNTLEFFAAQAVIDQLSVATARAMEITAERGFIGGALLEDNTITVGKLTALDEIMSELGRFLRIEAGALESNEIYGMIVRAAEIVGSVFRAEDADGTETVRLDGMENFFRGSIHAGLSDLAEVQIDHGDVEVENANGDTEVYETAYLMLRTPHSTKPPHLWVHPNTGTLYISAGGNESTPAFRGRVRVGGDLGANRLDGNQLLVRGGNEGSEGFTRVGGLLNSSGQVRVVGKHATSVSSQDMAVMGDGGAVRTVSSTGSYRADIVYGAPSDGGSRRPIVSTHMSNVSHDGGRMVSTTTARRGSAAFETRSRQAYGSTSGDASFFLYYHAAWE